MNTSPSVLQRLEPVPAEAGGQVLHLTLNRPESRNAMSLAMVDALLQALADAEARGDVRAIVLRGAGADEVMLGIICKLEGTLPRATH